MNQELQYYLQQTFQLPAKIHSMPEVEFFLAEEINELIKNNFNLLVQILYRVDVSEDRLKQVLKSNVGEDAGKIVAALIIERQLQKIESRRQFGRKNDNFSDEEKWYS
jgi:hypothetical protein